MPTFTATALIVVAALIGLAGLLGALSVVVRAQVNSARLRSSLRAQDLLGDSAGLHRDEPPV
jgi:hypothetical protein